MADNEIPQDPMTALTETAAQQHEIFLTWVKAGFTEGQALELLKAVITAAMLKALCTGSRT
jgi:hypothetical protein